MREGYLWNFVDGSLVDRRLLQMRADIGTDIKIGAFRAAAELGYASADGATFTQLAQVTRSDGANLVAREFWAGLELFGGDGLLRAGRMNVPFGLRNIEHTSFVRTATLTDINQDQQYGVAFAISKPTWRAEVMALLGNYSVHPDAYRERGAAGYLELSIAPTSAVGVSALAARSDASLVTRLPTLRQAYGTFLRTVTLAPAGRPGGDRRLARQAAGRSASSMSATPNGFRRICEVVRGAPSGSGALEGMKAGGTTRALQRGVWGGLWWFILPHLDMRADVIERGGQGPSNLTVLVSS